MSSFKSSFASAVLLASVIGAVVAASSPTSAEPPAFSVVPDGASACKILSFKAPSGAAWSAYADAKDRIPRSLTLPNGAACVDVKYAANGPLGAVFSVPTTCAQVRDPARLTRLYEIGARAAAAAAKLALPPGTPESTQAIKISGAGAAATPLQTTAGKDLTFASMLAAAKSYPAKADPDLRDNRCNEYAAELLRYAGVKVKGNPETLPVVRNGSGGAAFRGMTLTELANEARLCPAPGSVCGRLAVGSFVHVKVHVNDDEPYDPIGAPDPEFKTALRDDLHHWLVYVGDHPKKGPCFADAFSAGEECYSGAEGDAYLKGFVTKRIDKPNTPERVEWSKKLRHVKRFLDANPGLPRQPLVAAVHRP